MLPRAVLAPQQQQLRQRLGWHRLPVERQVAEEAELWTLHTARFGWAVTLEVTAPALNGLRNDLAGFAVSAGAATVHSS
eukprot:2162171-Amphidinium_carterae.1